MTNSKKKVISLISGGIDSPVATYLAMAEGFDIVAVHFFNYPFTDSKPKDNALDALEQIAKKTGKTIKVYIVPHGESLSKIAQTCERKIGCVLCRRMMFKISSLIAKEEGCVGIVTGESLGQVASQTLHNLNTEFHSANIPIIRPLLAMDKIDIEKIARDIGTFKISTRPSLCCTITPKKPATKAVREKAEHEESKLEMNELIKEAIDKMEIFEIKG